MTDIYSDEGGVRIDVRCFEFNTYGVQLRELTEYLVQEESRLERDSCSLEGHTTARLCFIFGDGVDVPEWSKIRLGLLIRMTSLSTGGSTGFVPMGVFLPETPSRMADETPIKWAVDCFDLLTLITTSAGQSFSVPAGITVGAAISRIVALAPVIPVDSRLTEIVATVQSSRQWPIQDAQSFLVAIDQLLESASWRSPWMNSSGMLTSEPWVDPATLVPVAHLRGETIEMGATSKDDTWAVPNRIVFVRDVIGDVPTEGDGIYVVDNIDRGPSSQSERAGRIVSAVYPVDVVDQASLVAYGNRVAMSLFQVPDLVCVMTIPRLDLWHRDVVTIESPDLGFDDTDKFLVQKWELPFDGSLMAVVLNGIGDSAVPPAPPAAAAPPSAVRNMSVSWSGTTVTVDWDAPASGTAPITYSVLRDGSVIVANNIAATQTTETNVPATPHVYTVVAINAHGTSRPVSRVTQNPGVRPSAVQNLTVTVGPPSFRAVLEWDAPAAGDTPIRYDVFRGFIRIADDITTTIYEDVNTPSTVTTYSVRAQNNAGTGPTMTVST